MGARFRAGGGVSIFLIRMARSMDYFEEIIIVSAALLGGCGLRHGE
jgi:hypothetical protein